MNFKCKISYIKQNENGSVVKVKEEYVVPALSFTEAEANLQSILESYIAEYNLESCTPLKVTDVIFGEGADDFYKAKIDYVSYDEDSGKEKKISETYLIRSNNLKDCLPMIESRMEGSVVNWEVTSVSKTNIADVFVAEQLKEALGMNIQESVESK